MTEPLQLALFGQPVKHSLSPRIHRAFSSRTGAPVEYQAIDTGTGQFAERWREFHESGGHGANITMPLKSMAAEIADQLDDSARTAGAVNTLVLQNRQWRGYNTDGWGLLADLDRLQIALTDQKVLILGAGGATAGILGPLLQRQPEHVLVANRTRHKAETLCQGHASDRLQALPWASIYELEQIDLLINATAMGHEGTAPQLPVAGLSGGGRVYDLNYGPAAAPLAAVCKRKTVAYESGMGMLVAQAARSFELWTGQMPDWSAVLETLDESS